MNDRERRLYEEFKELVEIDSVSHREREMADRLKEKLTAIGFEVYEDRAGDTCDGNAGNVYGFLKGTLPGDPILLSAHMDTVVPGIGKKAILHEGGKITSDGTTVLGSDDVAGLVEILEGVRSALDSGKPMRDVEVLFPIAEEVYSDGGTVFDYSRIKSKDAYVLDLSGAIGAAAIQAPTIISIWVDITGKASHAGFEPEKGIHAIKLMCEAVSQLKQGYQDEETTLNVGMISGGKATNIVPETCSIRAEIRSYDHQKALDTLAEMENIFKKTVEGTGAVVDIKHKVCVKAYKTGEETHVVKQFEKACETLGLPCELTRTFGGSDNNVYALYGIEGIVLSCGMYEVHSTKEYTLIEDLVKGSDLMETLITMA